jgi:small subunit ribosomal protein S20
VAHSLSAKKRVRQSDRHRAVNRARKSQVKTQIKKFETVMEGGDVKAATEEFRLLVKRLDQTAATSTMHKKTASRKKSRLAKRLNAMASKKAS